MVKGCFCSIDSQDWNNDWKEEYTIMLEWSKEPTTEDLKKLLDEQEYNIKMYTNSLKGLKDGDLFNEFTEKLCEAISIKEDIIKMLGGVWTGYRDWETDRKSTRLNSSHITRSRMPSSA